MAGVTTDTPVFPDTPFILATTVVRPAAIGPDSVHARHLYTLLIGNDAPITRDQFMLEMHQRRVGTGVHYRALHTHPYYAERWGFRPEQFPNADFIGVHTVSLPLTPKLSDGEVARIISSVRAILGGKV